MDKTYAICIENQTWNLPASQSKTNQESFPNGFSLNPLSEKSLTKKPLPEKLKEKRLSGVPNQRESQRYFSHLDSNLSLSERQSRKILESSEPYQRIQERQRGQ